MALSRRVARATKIVLAVEDGIVDPAVDIENSDIKAYWESHFDLKHIKIKTGWDPTYFVIKPLTRRQKDAVDILVGQRHIASWYIRCGLVKLYNYQILDEDDNLKDAPHPRLIKNGDLGEMISDEWLDEVSFTIDVRDSLFVCIAQITEAKAPLSGPSEQVYGQQK